LRQQIMDIHGALTRLRDDATDGRNWETLISNAKHELEQLREQVRVLQQATKDVLNAEKSPESDTATPPGSGKSYVALQQQNADIIKALQRMCQDEGGETDWRKLINRLAQTLEDTTCQRDGLQRCCGEAEQQRERDRATIREMTPYYRAIRSRHNGYNGVGDEPESPEAALDALIGEAEGVGMIRTRLEVEKALGWNTEPPYKARPRRAVVRAVAALREQCDRLERQVGDLEPYYRAIISQYRADSGTVGPMSATPETAVQDLIERAEKRGRFKMHLDVSQALRGRAPAEPGETPGRTIRNAVAMRERVEDLTLRLRKLQEQTDNLRREVHAGRGQGTGALQVDRVAQAVARIPVANADTISPAGRVERLVGAYCRLWDALYAVHRCEGCADIKGAGPATEVGVTMPLVLVRLILSTMATVPAPVAPGKVQETTPLQEPLTEAMKNVVLATRYGGGSKTVAALLMSRVPKCWRLDAAGNLVQDWPVIPQVDTVWQIDPEGYVNAAHDAEGRDPNPRPWSCVYGSGAQFVPDRPCYADEAAAIASLKKGVK
jgi:polyhydroxyalkanoate synthesis regulator phasin